MERIILHCDLNNFYASVETVLHPALYGKAVAVCGRVEDRHGIVLAKSEPAKKCGVKTAETIWQAQKKCPNLVIVPPHFDEYAKYSKIVRNIYYRYTDLVEPFGMDECWLDITGSAHLFGSAYDTAYHIKETVKRETGLTISVGISYNKVFAKLGSDLKKPDAITKIGRRDMKNLVWNLPADAMLWVGKSTFKTLLKYGVNTIGDLAHCTPEFLKCLFGKNGEFLWQCANGLEHSAVCNFEYKQPIKSVGRGITCTSDLTNDEEVWRVILTLSHSVSAHLRKEELYAGGIQIAIKNTALFTTQTQEKLSFSVCSSREIAQKAFEIFQKSYTWQAPVRAVTVRAIDLVAAGYPQQLRLDVDIEKVDKLEKLDETMLHLNERFGKRTIFEATLLQETKMPTIQTEEVLLPSAHFK